MTNKKFNFKKICSLVMSLAIIMNILTPTIVSANEIIEKANKITMSIERQTLGQEDIMPKKEITLKGASEKGSELFKRVLNENNIKFDNTGDLDNKFYISAIESSDGWIAEFDHGTQSGWKYMVNGYFPQVGLSEYDIKAGDEVRIVYTAKDMGKDILFVDKVNHLKDLVKEAESLNKDEYVKETYDVLKDKLMYANWSLDDYEEIGAQLSITLAKEKYPDLSDKELENKLLNISFENGLIDNDIKGLEEALDNLIKIEDLLPEPDVDVLIDFHLDWTDFDTIYLNENQDSINIQLDRLDKNDEVLLNGEKLSTINNKYFTHLNAGTNIFTIPEFGKMVDKHVVVKPLTYEIQGNVSPGETITIKFDNLTHQLTDNEKHPLKESQTRYKTNIPGLKEVKSELVEGENPDSDKLSTLTFTIPKDTEVGEYKLTNGSMYHKWGYHSLGPGFEKEFSHLPEITLDVTDKPNPNEVYDVLLDMWSEDEVIYTLTNKAYIRANDEIIALDLGTNNITVDGKDYVIKCEKITYEVLNKNQIVPGSEVVVKFDGIKEGLKNTENIDILNARIAYTTDIAKLDIVMSDNAHPLGQDKVDIETLNTIKFKLPNDLEPGEYNFFGGSVRQSWHSNGVESIPGEVYDDEANQMNKEFSRLPGFKINVLKEIETDTEAPKITTSLKENMTVNSSSLTFTASVIDNKDKEPTLTVKLEDEVISTNRPGRYEVRLYEGENNITIESSDKAGNVSKKEFTITCKPILKEGESIILDSEYLKLNIGDTHQIIAVEAHDKRSNEDEDTARMTYEVIEGKEIIEVSKYGKVKAVKNGVAKVNISYPGLKTPATILVKVGKSDNLGITTNIDETKYDTFYYYEGKSDYSFKVNKGTAKDIEVRVNDKLITSDNNLYNVKLNQGHNFIHIKGTKNGLVEDVYYNVKAQPVSIKIINKSNEGKEITQGDTVRIEFSGLYSPVPKFLRVFNPTNTKVNYEVNMNGMTEVSGEGTQYDIATNNAIEFIATQAGNFEFTNGHIDEKWWGDDLYSERDISGEGPNLNAPTFEEDFSSLPNFELTVKENKNYKPKYEVKVNKETFKPGEEVILSIDNLEKPDVYVSEMWSLKSIFNTNINGAYEVSSKEAKDNEELIKEIRFKIPKGTETGEYTITNGRVYQEWIGNSTLSEEKEFYKAEIPQVKINVVNDDVDVLPSVDVSDEINHGAKYIIESTKNPGYEDEWYILGLARGNIDVPKDYYKTYYNNLVKVLKEKDGNLHRSKYSEYSRVIITLTALGYDPTNVGGYNLVEKLYDFKNVSKQGINGIIFALIALDTKDFDIPSKANNSREMMIDAILSRQLDDGGFALSGDVSDPDITAMALTALSKYKDDAKVAKVIDEALRTLSNIQLSSGGYSSKDGENLESSAQVLVALSSLDISVNDPRFVKGDKNIVDVMGEYKVADGGYKHLLTQDTTDDMATEQALYSFVSYDRMINYKTNLYDMSDVKEIEDEEIVDPEIPTNPNEDLDDENDDKDTNEGTNDDNSDSNNENGESDNKNPTTYDLSIMGMVILALVSLGAIIILNKRKVN